MDPWLVLQYCVYSQNNVQLVESKVGDTPDSLRSGTLQFFSLASATLYRLPDCLLEATNEVLYLEPAHCSLSGTLQPATLEKYYSEYGPFFASNLPTAGCRANINRTISLLYSV